MGSPRTVEAIHGKIFLAVFGAINGRTRLSITSNFQEIKMNVQSEIFNPFAPRSLLEPFTKQNMDPDFFWCHFRGLDIILCGIAYFATNFRTGKL